MIKNDLKIINWLQENKQRLNITVIEETWVNEMAKGYHSIITHTSYNGIDIAGRGFAKSYREAYVISIMELIERYIVYSNKLPSSNGVAVHSTQSAAMTSSKNELIERDSFMCHYLNQVSPTLLSSENNFYKQTKNSLAKHKIDLSIYKLHSIDKTKHIVLSAIKGKNAAKAFGVTLGLGCNKNQEISIEKSLTESLHMAANFLVTDNLEAITLKQFTSSLTESGSIEHHYKLGLDTNYYELYKKQFTMADPPASLVNERELNDSFLFKNLLIPEFLNINFDIFAYQAQNDYLQSIFWGETSLHKVNKNRFRIDSNFKKRILQLGNFPHVFA